MFFRLPSEIYVEFKSFLQRCSFFKEIILDGPLGETKYYAICIEFEERGSPHVHSFIWIFNVPNIGSETAYIEFIEKIINVQFPGHLKDLELFELVKGTVMQI